LINHRLVPVARCVACPLRLRHDYRIKAAFRRDLLTPDWGHKIFGRASGCGGIQLCLTVIARHNRIQVDRESQTAGEHQDTPFEAMIIRHLRFLAVAPFSLFSHLASPPRLATRDGLMKTAANSRAPHADALARRGRLRFASLSISKWI
jgi:hypothetical protein